MAHVELIRTPEERAQWDRFAEGIHVGHLHQCFWWTEPLRARMVHTGVVVLRDQGEIVGGALFRSLYIPYANVSLTECLDGPIFSRWRTEWAMPFLEGVTQIADKFNSAAVFVKCCPDPQVHKDLLSCAAIMRLKTTIVPGETRAVVDLTNGDFEDVSARFDQNLKRNIKKAQKSGVTVRQVIDPEGLRQGYLAWIATSGRKGFSDVRPWPLLEPIIRDTTEKGLGCVLASYKDDRMLGAIFLTCCGGVAEYQYGGFFDGTEEFRPNHILHNEALRIAIERKMRSYNLGTLLRPDSPGEHGVDRFKLGFRPHVTQMATTIVWERRPLLYNSYRWLKRQKAGRRLERVFKSWLKRS